ncbi:MAG: AAA family ATPase [Solirubrobacterales bacterium]
MHNDSNFAAVVQAFGRVLAAESNPAKRASLVKRAELFGMNNASDESMDLGKFASPKRASEEKIVNIRWLWKGFLPLGTYSGVYGTEGDGKSVFTVWLAAQATLGKLPGHLQGKPTCVEFVAYEDDYAAVITPRLIAAGADLDRCYFHGGTLGDEPLILPDDGGSPRAGSLCTQTGTHQHSAVGPESQA